MKTKVWAEYSKCNKRFTGDVVYDGPKPVSVFPLSYTYKKCRMIIREVKRTKKASR